MTRDEALELVGDLQSAFRRELSEKQEEQYIRVLIDYDVDQAADALRVLVENEERFPPVAVLIRYIGRPSDGGITEHERQRATAQLGDEIRHMARIRGEPFEQTVRGHLAMCEQNADITGDEETWGERAKWCRELLRREVGNALPDRRAG